MSKDENKDGVSRRKFLKAGILTSIGVGAFPTIVPANVVLTKGKGPNDKINIGSIGVGRISTSHDMPGIAAHPGARIIAVADLDETRAKMGPEMVKQAYKRAASGAERRGKAGVVEEMNWDVAVYTDYKELLDNKSIDAVHISLPDHHHAIVGVYAVNAGKDVYLQKPASLTVEEGRILSNAVHRTGRILQIGSQQRSDSQWRKAAEFVRNGRIGKLTHVEIGLPIDPPGGDPKKMPIPKGLNYDAWLGSTPEVYYTQDRVHSEGGITGRPGWLRCEQFGAGMITGWGAHHIDSAHWGMDTEYTGPVEIWGKGQFPTDDKNYKGLWDVHGKYEIQAVYANGVNMRISDELPNGVKYIGTEGWVWVSRGPNTVTDSDPAAYSQLPLNASNKSIIESPLGVNDIHLYESTSQHGNWLDCIRTRQVPISPVEMGHKACTVCLISQIAMKLDRKLYWDPVKEQFKNDKEANSMLSRPRRAKYDFPV